MKITLKKLTLTNFKGAKSIEIDFANETHISGRNATGKSTIYDAFTWLLFGKNSNDLKDFSVKTWDASGNIIPKIEHEVTGIISIDGVETALTRTLKEKWVKKRGEEISEFSGNETLYFINSVPKSQSEYQSFISGIIPETTFKLLTSPSYFNSLKWSDRREMLISIVGTPTNEDIAGTDLANVISIMETEKKTVEDLKKEYSAKRKKLKDELDKVPTRIDENNRDTPEPLNFTKIEKELAETKQRLFDVNLSILDKSHEVEKEVRLRSEKLIEKNNLETRLQNLEFDAKIQFANSGNAKDAEIRNKEAKVLNLKQSIANYDSDISGHNARIESLEKQVSELREKYTLRNAETLEFNSSMVCPTCGQSLPDDLVELKENEAIAKFNADKVLDLNSYALRAKELKAQIVQLNETIATCKAKRGELIVEKVAFEDAIIEYKETPVLTKSIEAILAENFEYTELKQTIAAITIPEVKQVDTTELQTEKATFTNQIAALEADLRIRDRITEKTARKQEIEKQGREYSQQIASLEKMEFQIEKFSNRKMQEVENRVNYLFPNIRFRMFNQLINGGFEDACECLVNGVPYADTNSAHKTLAGLEIISVFSKVHGLYCPVWIDNSEGINTIPEMDNQVIKLFVTGHAKLTVTT